MRIRVLRYTLPWRAMETNGQNVRVELAINGHDHALDVPAGRLLIDLLRADLGLTGTKEGCSVGVCGA